MVTLAPWYWRSLPLGGCSGAVVFQRLFLPRSGTMGPMAIATLLESPASEQHQSCYSICAGPPRQDNSGRYRIWTPALGSILPCLKQLLAQGQRSWQASMAVGTTFPPDHLPFTGGWLGWLGYDLSWEIERLPWRRNDNLPFPVGYWYEPEAFAVIDHGRQQLWLAASHPLQLDQLQRHLELCQEIPAVLVPARASQKLSPSRQPQLCMGQAEYQAAVLRAKQYIQAGDIFQANLSLRFQTEAQVDSWLLYQTLQKINPSPFACFWQTPWGNVVSCSPERLVRLKGRQVETRPIAGTRSRGQTPEQDYQLAQELLTNAKEKAEHTMLVDLERNDLGRVCQWGSVRVDELLTVEYYSHVMHLVSNVVGELRPNQDAIAVIQALFPGGTITGCPKVSCLEIIEELESVRRSLFYGSCGYLDQRGNLDLNILIRTLLVAPRFSKGVMLPEQPALIWGQVGAGIVADSQPEQEWYESLQKAQAQFDALQRIIC